MSEIPAANPTSEPASGNTQTQSHTRPRRQPRHTSGQPHLLAPQGNTASSIVSTDNNVLSSTPTPRSFGNRHQRPPYSQSQTTQDASNVGPTTTSQNVRGREGRNRNRNNKPGQSPSNQPDSAPSTEGDAKSSTVPSKTTQRSGRRGGRQFGASLTEEAAKKSASTSSADVKPSEKFRRAAPKKDDLTSTLIHALSTSPYPDCLICFLAIHPAQPTWSCSPSSSLVSASEDEGAAKGTKSGVQGSAQCCWTTFHLKCIRSWASKSVKQVADAWRARGEDKPGDWRCPGCQSKRTAVPSSYW